MKFTHATHLLDVDGAQITSGVTRGGDVHLLVMDGTGTARLTPELAERLAEILRECARHARGGHYWAPLRGSAPCPRCGTAAGELHREDCGPGVRVSADLPGLPGVPAEVGPVTCLGCEERSATVHHASRGDGTYSATLVCGTCGGCFDLLAAEDGYLTGLTVGVLVEAGRRGDPRVRLDTAEPSGPGIRCLGCGALPDEQHREECAERDPGPVAPSPWGDRPEPEDPDRDRMDDAELASHQAHEPAPLDEP